jgi:hypothetical protein
MFSMKKLVIAVAGLVFISLNVVACSAYQKSSTASSSATASAESSATAAALTSDAVTTDAIKAAAWNPTVKLTYTDGSVIMEPNGIPDHERDAYYAVPDPGVIVPDSTTASLVTDPTKEQTYKFTISTAPKYVTTVTSAPLGSIGVMISGTVLYNPFEGDGTTVAMASNFTITDANGNTGSFIDKCAGHPTLEQGAYHYHGLSICVTAKVDEVSKQSHIIGFALDGFPIYGDRDINGKQLTASNLDECNGITSATPEFPGGIYHYVLLGTADARSSITCFHGEVDESQIQPMPAMGGGQMPGPANGGGQMPMPDLAVAAKELGVTQDALMAALGRSMPPDTAAAAKKLGVTEKALRDALGVTGKP